jgi:hypothetical protein
MIGFYKTTKWAEIDLKEIFDIGKAFYQKEEDIYSNLDVDER